MPNGIPDDFGQDFSPASYLDSIMNGMLRLPTIYRSN